MTLLLCARQLVPQEGVYWVVPDSDSVSAVCTYHEGRHCGDGIHHLYAHTHGTKRLAPRAAINAVVTPSHWIAAINVRVDRVTTKELQADLGRMLRRPHTFLPLVKFRDQCQLAPGDLQVWLPEQAATPRSGALRALTGT